MPHVIQVHCPRLIHANSTHFVLRWAKICTACAVGFCEEIAGVELLSWPFPAEVDAVLCYIAASHLRKAPLPLTLMVRLAFAAVFLGRTVCGSVSVCVMLKE